MAIYWLILLVFLLLIWMFGQRVLRSTSSSGPSPTPPSSPPTTTQAPAITILRPGGGTHSPLLLVNYEILDINSHHVDIEIDYSLDNGNNYQPCTEFIGSSSEGRLNLSSSPAGNSHRFVWNAGADIAVLPAFNVLLRIRGAGVNTGNFGQWEVSAPFMITALVAPPTPPPPPPPPGGGGGPPGAPGAQVFQPLSNSGPLVALRFVVSDPGSLPVDVKVQFRYGTRPWTDATAADESDGLTRLPAPFLSANYRFIWDALADLGQFSATVTLRIVVTKGSLSEIRETASFAVNTTPPAPPAAFTPKQAVNVGRVIRTSGDHQSALAGQWFKEPLRVSVVDIQNRPIQGARVTFSEVAPAGAAANWSAPFELHEDPENYRITDGRGITSIRVRALAGVAAGGTISGQVKATVVGDPVATIFDFTLHHPKIESGNLPAQLSYGLPAFIELGLVGPGNDIRQLEYHSDPARPLQLNVQVSNAEVDQQQLLLPDARGRNPGGVYIVPTDPNSPVQLQVSVADDPTIAPRQFSFPVVSPASTRRVNPPTHAGPSNIDVKLWLRPKGAGTTSPSWRRQTGYPGLTLALPMQLELTDGTTIYAEEVTANFSDCNVGPVKQALGLEYTTTQGLLSTTPVPGTDTSLPVSVNEPVYFTPSGPGPWQVQARTTGAVFDVHHQRVVWNDPNQNTHCVRDHTFNQNQQGVYTFLFDLPPRARLLEAATAGTATPTVIDELHAGDRVALEIRGLSPVAAGSAEKMTLGTAKSDQELIIDYQGIGGFQREQSIDLRVDTSIGPTRLISTSGILLQGQPEQLPAANWRHWLLPGGWLRLSSASMNWGRIAVAAGRPQRQQLDAVELPFENVAGTTAMAGLGKTVIARTGELLLSASDLNLTHRGGDITVERHFRGFSHQRGPFGPGWFFAQQMRLHIARNKGLVLINETGREDAFTENSGSAGESPSAGLFMTLQRKSILDADSSAFELMGPHRDVIHFNIDGSLRMYVDAKGNRVSYLYDGKARLIGLRDPHNRRITISYDTADRIIEISDFSNRNVRYSYYPAGHALAGWLQKIEFPETDTVVAPGAQPQPNYRRNTRYNYQLDPQNAERGQLLTVTDSTNTVLLDNQYDSLGRVEKQLRGNQNYQFDYSTHGQTTVENPDGGQRTYLFTAWPLADGVAPVALIDENQLRLDYEHNRDGLLTRKSFFGGEELNWVYDERASNPRRHGNALAQRQRSPAGEERTVENQFSRRFNKLLRTVPARGNRAGASADLYSSDLVYDHQIQPGGSDPDLRPGDAGNLVRISSPRSMHMVVGLDGQNRHKQFWVDDNPRRRMRYNGFGQLNWLKDEHGVVTEFDYYSDATPTRGAFSADGGGFLARVRRDTENNPLRDQVYVQQQNLQTQQILLEYDDLGRVNKVTDPDGNVVRQQTNALHELIQVEQQAAVSGSSQPAQIIKQMHWNHQGVMVRSVLLQPGADLAAGGSSLSREITTDAYGHTIEARSDAGDGRTAKEILIRNHCGGLREIQSPDQHNGLAAAAGRVVELDAGNRPRKIHFGTAAGAQSGLHEQSFSFTQNGRIETSHLPGAANGYSHHYDKFGEFRGIVDPLGNVQRADRDIEGNLSRQIEQFGEGGANPSRSIEPPPMDTVVMSFGEQLVDELGRPTRQRLGHFRPAAAGSAQVATPAIPEFVNGPQPWPPTVGELDSSRENWGDGDSRTTQDRVFDARNQPTRVFSDRLAFAYTRRDAHGRPWEQSLWAGLDRNAPSLVAFNRKQFNGTGQAIEQQNDLYSSNPALPGLHLKSKTDYDPVGRPVREVDGSANAVRSEYDESGHAYVVYDEMGVDSSEQFNGHAINAPGNETRSYRDGLGRIINTETYLTLGGMGGAARDTGNPYNPRGVVGHSSRFSDEGRLLAVTDQAGNRTRWRYDSYGRFEQLDFATATTLGGATSRRIEYNNNNGQVWKVHEPNGSVKEYDYNEIGKVSRVVTTDSNGNTAGYSYGYFSDRTVITDINSGETLELAVDSSGRTVAEKQLGVTVSAEYDSQGKRRALRYGTGGREVRYHRDSLGRLRRLEESGTPLTTIEYLGPERVHSRTRLGLSEVMRYEDGSGDLLGMTQTGLSAGPVNYTLRRDRKGRLQQAIRNASGTDELRNWEYDSAGRVVRETWRPNTGSSAILETSRLFDGDNVLREERREHLTSSGIQLQHTTQQREERGRVTRMNTQTMAYNANGNLTDDGRQHYTWDAWDRLTSVSRGGQTVVEYDYDGMHRLVRRRPASGPVQEFIHDGWHLIEVRENGQPVEQYVYGDQLDEVVEVLIGQDTFLPLYSPTGSVEALADANLNLVERYTYDLNGRVQVWDANGQLQPGAQPLSRFLFQRHEWEADVGLYRFRRRWYHPQLGTFMSADPAGFAEGPNLYALACGDPINFSDAFGLLSWGQVLGIGAAIVVGAVVTAATAGMAGPVVGTAIAGIIGGVVGGAAAGATGAAVESYIDTGSVDGDKVITGAIVGGIFGGVFSGLGAFAASQTGRALATRAATSSAGRLVGAGIGRIAGSGFVHGARSLASRTVGTIADFTPAPAASFVQGGLQLASRGLLSIQRGLFSIEVLGGRVTQRALQRMGVETYTSTSSHGMGMLMRSRAMPIIDDALDDIGRKMEVFLASAGNGIDDAANAARNTARGNVQRGALSYEDYVTIVDDGIATLGDDLLKVFRIERTIETANNNVLMVFRQRFATSMSSTDDFFVRYLSYEADLAQIGASSVSNTSAASLAAGRALGGTRSISGLPAHLINVLSGQSARSVAIAAALGTLWDDINPF